MLVNGRTASIAFSVTYPQGKAKGITPGTAKAPAQVYSYIIANLSQQDAQQRAMKIYNDIIRHELKMTAQLPGDNILMPNVMVQVSGTETQFDSMYYVESVARRMSFDSGYTMSVRGKNHSLDTSVIRYTIAGTGAPATLSFNVNS